MERRKGLILRFLLNSFIMLADDEEREALDRMLNDNGEISIIEGELAEMVEETGE